jgi:hypothetical protein
MTGVTIFTIAGFLPAFADSGAQTIPLPPTGLNATAVSDTQISLTWSPPINATQSGVTGYQIQRNGTVIVNDTANTLTAFNDTSLLPGSQKEYQVAAWNSVGLGLLSNFAFATADNPAVSTPTNQTNSTSSSQTNSTSSSQTTDNTQPSTDQTTPSTDQTTPSTDQTTPSVGGNQIGYGTHNHYRQHGFYAGNQTSSYFTRMNLGHAMWYKNHNVLSNGQGNGTLGIFHHSSSGIQSTSHAYSKGVVQFTQKFMQSKQLFRNVQKQGFGQLKTQSWIHTQTFKQQRIGAVGTTHFDKNVSWISSNNLGNGFVKHVVQTNNVSFGYVHYLSHGTFRHHM